MAVCYVWPAGAINIADAADVARGRRVRAVVGGRGGRTAIEPRARRVIWPRWPLVPAVTPAVGVEAADTAGADEPKYQR